MKKDKLDQFIEENKRLFDTHESPPHVWPQIAQSLLQKEQGKKNWFQFMKIAAGVALLIFSGLFAGMSISNFYHDQNDYVSIEQIKEYREAENYYQTQVNLALSSNEVLAKDGHLIEDLNLLDQSYEELMLELKNPNIQNREIIIHALIQNHQLKLELLKKVLNQLNNRSNTIKNENISI